MKKSRNIRAGNSKFGPEFRVRIDIPHEGLVLRIGDRCALNNQFIFEGPDGQISIGDDVFINTGTNVISQSSIEIGNAVTIGWGCTVYDHDSHSLSYLERIKDHDLRLKEYPDESVAKRDWTKVATSPIRICDHAWLGFDVVILKGVTVGEGAIIGARSVVTKDVPPWTVAVGNPARVVKEIPRELRKS